MGTVLLKVTGNFVTSYPDSFKCIMHLVPANLFDRRNSEFHYGPRACPQSYTPSLWLNPAFVLGSRLSSSGYYIFLLWETQSHNIITQIVCSSTISIKMHEPILKSSRENTRRPRADLVCICIGSLLEPAIKAPQNRHWSPRWSWHFYRLKLTFSLWDLSVLQLLISKDTQRGCSFNLHGSKDM